MKQLYVLLLHLACLFTVCSHAQGLTKSTITTGYPEWKKEDDYMDQRLPNKLVAEMKKIMSVLSLSVQSVYPEPQGCDATWQGAYFSNKENAFPLFKYEMRSRFYIGDSGSSDPGSRKESRFTITANDLSLLQQPFDLNGKTYPSVRLMKPVFNGIWYDAFRNDKEDTAAGFRQIKTWLISYPDSLPYFFMTRKEYLEQALQEIAAGKEGLKEDLKQRIPVKSFEEEEATKKREIAEIENTYSGVAGSNLVKRWLASYKPDSVYFKEVFTAKAIPFDADSVRVDSLLKKSSAEDLQRPAIVSGPASGFSGFADSLSDGRALIKWNMDYFNRQISMARPQFMVVVWQYDPSNGVAAEIDKQLAEKFDFCILSGLLGR